MTFGTFLKQIQAVHLNQLQIELDNINDYIKRGIEPFKYGDCNLHKKWTIEDIEKHKDITWINFSFIDETLLYCFWYLFQDETPVIEFIMKRVGCRYGDAKHMTNDVFRAAKEFCYKFGYTKLYFQDGIIVGFKKIPADSFKKQHSELFYCKDGEDMVIPFF